MANHSDKDLISGCIKNDRFYQEKLYRKYFPVMIGMCMRYTNDREEAMMIVNDGFLRVFKKIEKYSGFGSFEGWIRKIVFNSISDYFKKNSKYIRFFVFEEHEKVSRDAIVTKLYFEDLLFLVRKLPDLMQEVFVLYAIEGFTHGEISKRLNIAEGTSKWYLFEARKKLKNMINRIENHKNYAK